MKKINDIILNIFNVFFAIAFTFITCYVISNNAKIKADLIVPTIVTVFSVCLCILLTFKFVNSYKLKKIKTIKICIFCVIIFIQLIFGFKCKIVSSWDSGVIMDVSSRIANNTYNGDSTEYFSMYNNNIPIVILLTNIFKFVHLFFGANSNYMAVAIVINIVLIDIGIYLTQKVVEKVYGENNSLFALIFMAVIAPLYCYTPIIYTDTFTVLFPVLILYLYILSTGENITLKRKVIFSILIGLVTFVGMRLKITVVFILIAILVLDIFRLKFTKKEIKEKSIRYGVIFATIIILFMIKTIIYSCFINNKLDDSKKFPFTHWIMMGLSQDCGVYSEDDVNYTKSFETEKLKKESNIKVIKERLKEKNVKFYLNKINFVWGDGTYFSSNKLVQGSYEKNFFHEFVTSQGKYYKYYHIFVQTIHFSMLILITISSFIAIFKEDEVNLICRISIFGLLLFFILWEARSRYIFNYIFILVIAMISTLNSLKEWIKNKKKNYDNEIKYLKQ